MRDLIKRIHRSVATYKSQRALCVIQEVASGLRPYSKVLIIGAGCGAETIVIKKSCPTSIVTAIDKWEGDVDYYGDGRTSVPGTNFKEDFDLNCINFKVDIDHALKTNIYESSTLENLHSDWDFIYYDCEDNGKGESFHLVLDVIKLLWKKLRPSGILMGDDYMFDKPDFKMSPIIDSFVDSLNDVDYFDVDKTDESHHWLVRKHG